MRLAARRVGGDQAATRAQVVGLVKHRHQHSLLQFGCNERGASEGHPQARRGRVNQQAAETEARGVRQVRRKGALGREPGRPIGWPAQMVEQGPGTQGCRVGGLAARLEKLRTTDGEQRLLEQLLPAKDFHVRRPGLAVIGDPKVEVSPVGGAAHVVGLQRDGEVGPDGGKGRDFRHEPPLGKGFDRDDAQAPLRRHGSVAVHDCGDLCEETVNVPKTGLAAQVQLEPAATAVKQGMADVIFEYLDAVGDGRGGDLEFLGGADEALMPGGGLEEAETLKGRQGGHHLDSVANKFGISKLCHNKKRRRAQVGRGRSGAATASALGGVGEVGQDALDVGVVLTATLVEVHPTLAADEQRGTEMAFEHADAVGDRGGGDPEFRGGADEALMPGGGIEEAETLKWR